MDFSAWVPRVALGDSLTRGYYLSPRWGFRMGCRSRFRKCSDEVQSKKSDNVQSKDHNSTSDPFPWLSSVVAGVESDRKSEAPLELGHNEVAATVGCHGCHAVLARGA